MEAVIALPLIFHKFNFSLVPDQEIGMTTGAIIHTANDLYITAKEGTGPSVGFSRCLLTRGQLLGSGSAVPAWQPM